MLTSLRAHPFWRTCPTFRINPPRAHTLLLPPRFTAFSHHLISALTPSAATEVYDILASPSPSTPYHQLKQALLQRTTLSSRSRLQQLLSTEELGDRRPSQLLRRMRQLLGDQSASVDDALLRDLFLQRLLQNVQIVKATAADMTLDQLDTLGDAVMEVANTAVAAVFPALPPSEPDRPQPRQLPLSTIDDLCREFRSLAALIAASHASRPKKHIRRQRRDRRGLRPRRSPSTNRSASRDRSPALCWYHRRFGADAHHCFLPCSWQQHGNQSVDH
ncbi:uncharacterized protein LOC135393482 [Ornithodoros turicata]|uniref:uncharacterized protein LOC135393482 n=1 Tax=Ornithodoros turicata TaxID=34597 RepID=UPI00313A4804